MFFANPILGSPRPTYRHARDALHEKIREIKGSHVAANIIPGTAEDGGNLHFDVITIGPEDPEVAIVIGGAIHGVEGLTTLAAQWEMLEWYSRNLQHLTVPTTLYILPTINAYGIAHCSRYNANNVDLNRNFVAHPAKLVNVHYRKLSPHINPTSLDHFSELYHKAMIGWWKYRLGERELVEAVSSGQYEFPRGVQFGGHRPEMENQLVIEFLSSFPRTPKKIVWIDMHCGLGEKGKLLIMDDHPLGLPTGVRLKNWFGDLINDPTDGVISTNPEGFGAVDRFAETKLLSVSPNAEITGFCAEFGTAPLSDVIWAVRARNWAEHYGAPYPTKVREIKRRMHQCFYPDNEEWRDSVRGNARRLIELTFAGLFGRPFGDRKQ